MLTREEGLQKLKEIIQEEKDIRNRILAFLKEDFRQVLEYFRKAKLSIKHLAHEVLELIKGADLKEKEEKFEKILAESARTLVQTIRDASFEGLEEARKLADGAKERLDKALDASDKLELVEEEIRREAEDLFRELVDAARAGKKGLQEAEEALKEFGEKYGRELSEDVRKELDEIARKTREHIKDFEVRAGKYMEKFLGHADEKARRLFETIKNEKREGEKSDG